MLVPRAAPGRARSGDAGRALRGTGKRNSAAVARAGPWLPWREGHRAEPHRALSNVLVPQSRDAPQRSQRPERWRGPGRGLASGCPERDGEVRVARLPQS